MLLIHIKECALEVRNLMLRCNQRSILLRKLCGYIFKLCLGVNQCLRFDRIDGSACLCFNSCCLLLRLGNHLTCLLLCKQQGVFQILLGILIFTHLIRKELNLIVGIIQILLHQAQIVFNLREKCIHFLRTVAELYFFKFLFLNILCRNHSTLLPPEIRSVYIITPLVSSSLTRSSPIKPTL